MSSNSEHKAVVKVNFGNGQDEVTHVGATDFQISDGHLLVDSSTNRIAAYAPGKWLSVKLVKPTA